MARILSAVFDDRNDAEQAVDWMRNNGAPNDSISVISRHEGTVGGDQLPDPRSPDGKRSAADGAGEAGGGLATGLGVGAGVGALFGLAALLIPGVGPLIAAGPLAAALGVGAGTVAAGAIVGGAAGSLAGALSHWGLSEAEAHHYAERVESGSTYVGVDLDQTSLDRTEALETIRRFNGHVQDMPSDGGVTGMDDGISRTAYAGERASGTYGAAITGGTGSTGATGYRSSGADANLDDTDELVSSRSQRDRI